MLYLWNCAKTGSIEGGPRDTTPPVVLKTKPLKGVLNYTGKSVEITFDEYIRTDEISEELYISPPFKERIETTMKGKTLVVRLEDTLYENTTYTLRFGQSIKDLNEGNVLNNYEFIFSTGSFIDSLAVSGMVIQAIDLEPVEEKVSILLYSNLSDSAPYLEVPEYMTVATPEGAFLVNNIRPATYRIFALQDQNRNLKYDVPEEQIGFLDSLIVLSPDLFEFIDTSTLAEPGAFLPDSSLFTLGDSVDFSMDDSLLLAADDSLTLFDLARYSVMVDLFTFREDNEPQYLVDNKREDRRKLSLQFNREVMDTVSFEPYGFTATGDWFINEPHIMRDTFVYWITDSLVYQRDSLQLIAHYSVTDSLLNYESMDDTLRFNYREPARSGRRRERDAEEEEEKISLSFNINNNTSFDYYKDIIITSNHPVSVLDTSKIQLTYLEDTLDMKATYSWKPDSFFLRSWRLVSDWKEEYYYTLNLFPGALTDIYGITHDTIEKTFDIQHHEHYGLIDVNLNKVAMPVVVHLIDEKNRLAGIDYADTDGAIQFNNLNPGKYTIKVIFDANRNGIWDTGNYLKGIQPERILFHDEEITVRSNFDYTVNMDLSEKSPSE